MVLEEFAFSSNPQLLAWLIVHDIRAEDAIKTLDNLLSSEDDALRADAARAAYLLDADEKSFVGELERSIIRGEVK